MAKKGKRLFLSAGWHNLLLFNYAVPPKILEAYLPPGAELDTRDGSAHLSLVAFQFLRTRVLGVQWPGFTNFPEINFRFYVKYQGERGVCFIREYVPSRIVASLARLTYNEPYRSAAIEDVIVDSKESISAEYRLNDGQAGMRLYATADKKPSIPAESSWEHYFKEHELGVGRDRKGRLQTYRVHHPHWEIYPVKKYELQINAKELYGEDFGFLEAQIPVSVVFAAGSDIQVFFKDR